MATDGSIGIRPAEGWGDAAGHLNYRLAPGAAAEGRAVVENLGGTGVELLVYPVDATTAADGAFALRNRAEPRLALGSWLTLDAGRISLAAGERREIAYRLSVPTSAAPGPYAGGIVAEPLEPEVRGGSGLSLAVISRVGLRVYERVPGPTAVGSRARSGQAARGTGATVATGHASWWRAGGVAAGLLLIALLALVLTRKVRRGRRSEGAVA